MVENSDTLTAAHAASSNHREEIGGSELCGCFYCLRTFPPAAIVEWVDEPQGGQTAVCPYCQIDSVLGSASGFPLTRAFLAAMCDHWFS